jgi:hypothetical protein
MEVGESDPEIDILSKVRVTTGNAFSFHDKLWHREHAH